MEINRYVGFDWLILRNLWLGGITFRGMLSFRRSEVERDLHSVRARGNRIRTEEIGQEVIGKTGTKIAECKSVC